MSQTVELALQQAAFYSDDQLYTLVHLPPAAITAAASVLAQIGEPFAALIADKDEVTLLISSEALAEFSSHLPGHNASLTAYRLITIRRGAGAIPGGLYSTCEPCPGREHSAVRRLYPRSHIGRQRSILDGASGAGKAENADQDLRFRFAYRYYNRNMDIPFFPNDVVPRPKDEIRIEELEVVPYPDRVRVFIHVKVTPFQERPNLLLVAHDAEDRAVSELNVIETMHFDMEFTMHLRNVQYPDPAGVYTLTVDLFYETRNPPQDRRIESFTIPEAEEGL